MAPACGILFFATLISPACVSKTPLLSPPPERVETINGFGSLVLRGEGGSAKTRFSFLFNLPDSGRIEALDVFGRAMSVLIFKEGVSYFILPSRNAYWKGPEEVLWEKFMGFRMKAHEAASLLSGQWTAMWLSEESTAWTLERDVEGRVLKGEKEDFRFEIKEFFQKTSVPRSVIFSQNAGSGKVRVLDIHFNRPPGRRVFDLSILDGRQQKTWPEMEALLNDED